MNAEDGARFEQLEALRAEFQKSVAREAADTLRRECYCHDPLPACSKLTNLCAALAKLNDSGISL